MPPHVLTWRWFAKTYGYHPDQVEELPLEAITWFPIIEDASHSAQEWLNKQEMKAARSQGPGMRR